MAPKKDGKEEKDDSDEYTYLTEEEEEEPEPMPSTKAAEVVSPNEKAAVAAVRSYEARAAKDEPSSSDDRGPRARDRRSPSPARRERRDRPPPVEPRRSRVPDRETRDTREAAPFPSLPIPAPGLPPPPPPDSLRGNWTTKGRKQRCPHCWQKVGSRGRFHFRHVSTYVLEWALLDVAMLRRWDALLLGRSGCPSAWGEAGQRGRGICSAGRGGHASSLAQSAPQEEAKETARSGQAGLPREDKEKRQEHRGGHADGPRDHPEKAEKLRRRRAEVPQEPEEKEETSGRRRKHKKHRHRRSPSPDVRAGPKGPKEPPSDDEDDRETGPAKRRRAPDEVWIKVPRSALMGHWHETRRRTRAEQNDRGGMGLLRSVPLSRSCYITFPRSVDMSPLHILSGSASFASSWLDLSFVAVFPLSSSKGQIKLHIVSVHSYITMLPNMLWHSSWFSQALKVMAQTCSRAPQRS